MATASFRASPFDIAAQDGWEVFAALDDALVADEAPEADGAEDVDEDAGADEEVGEEEV